ncbi:MAG TPA: VOC family protein, partial [Candidatus Limnocylindria bacterium]|nr:VOC family protein [Candidatus Limnocylindria bacterium]
VSDMSRAAWFYEEVLGLQPLQRPPFDFGGAWYRLGHGTLHLIVHPPSRTVRGTRAIDPRDGHLALRVRSYEETLARLKSFGLECLELPDNLTPWAQIYVTDPDGNVVEFNVERSELQRQA